MSKKIPKIGDKFGWLTVFSDPFVLKDNEYCKCKCRCGESINVLVRSLHHGWNGKKTCGCVRDTQLKRDKEEIARFKSMHSEHKVNRNKSHVRSAKLKADIDEFLGRGGKVIKL